MNEPVGGDLYSGSHDPIQVFELSIEVVIHKNVWTLFGHTNFHTYSAHEFTDLFTKFTS